jgi:general stress protein YciG
MPLKRSKPHPAQCKATTPSGEPCRAKPHKEGLCFFHSDPKKAAELGRKGGRRRAVYSPDGLKEFAAPRSAADLRDLLAQSIIEIRSGKLDPKLANSISYLGAGFLRALEVSDLETRLQTLEERTENDDGKSQAQS